MVREKEQTKYVLTGGPCCGKTTLINELEQRGYSVLEEVARQVIEKRKHIPTSQEEWIIREDLISKMQLEKESQLPGSAFLDRGLQDIVAYSNHFLGFIPEAVKDIKLADRYSKIFVLDMLPFEDDGLRVESGSQEAQEIHEMIISAYKETGYPLIYVPVFSGPKEQAIKQRADYVLDKIK